MFFKGRIPEVKIHKASGLAYVNLSGRRVYLGKPGAEATQRKFDRAIAEWLAAGRQRAIPQGGAMLVEVLDRYWTHAQGYYRDADGAPARSLDRIRLVIADVRRLYGDIPADQFTPTCLKALREVWIARRGPDKPPLGRKTINDYMSEARKIFRWAVGEELVSPGVLQALEAVAGLKAGRSEATESRKVSPVRDAHIDAIRPHVAGAVWALIQLQLLTGARSGEVLHLRPCDLDTSGDVWIVRLDRHKTAHHGKSRTLRLGPRAQATIRPFLQDRPLDAFLFSPREAAAERKALTRETEEGGRRENQPPTKRKTPRKVGACYTKDSYARAIRRACKAAGVPHWHPHQLRHNHATAVRKLSGIEAASVALGHSRISTAEIYAEKNEALAREIALKIG